MHNVMPDIYMCQSWIQNRDGIKFPTKSSEKFTKSALEIEVELKKSQGTCHMSEICEIFQPVRCSDGVSVFAVAISDAEWTDLLGTFPEIVADPPDMSVTCLQGRMKDPKGMQIKLNSEELKERLKTPGGGWGPLPKRLAELPCVLELGNIFRLPP